LPYNGLIEIRDSSGLGLIIRLVRDDFFTGRENSKKAELTAHDFENN
jgi:hypothetical protein